MEYGTFAEGTTYIRQGGNQVGHRSTFLVYGDSNWVAKLLAKTVFVWRRHAGYWLTSSAATTSDWYSALCVVTLHKWPRITFWGHHRLSIGLMGALALPVTVSKVVHGSSKHKCISEGLMNFATWYRTKFIKIGMTRYAQRPLIMPNFIALGQTM